VIIFFLVLNSCVLFPGDKPLEPRLMFTVGSKFLEPAGSVALKGSIEFENGRISESGSFQMIMNRGDSLAFIIEGPFKIDIFRLVLVDKTAYARDRSSDLWTVVRPDEKLEIPEYGIDNLTPDFLGYFVFPQFYSTGSLHFDSEKMLLTSPEYSFGIFPSRNKGSFTMENREIGLQAVYSGRKSFVDGYYPSRIEISRPGNSWKITFEIEKVRLDPRVSPEVWERNS
jgi:hypothetical protein